MDKLYYELCVGDNWNKVICTQAVSESIDELDFDEYDPIHLKEVIKNKSNYNKHSLFHKKNRYNTKEYLDSPIYVEKVGLYLEDVITGIKFPTYYKNGNERILFHACYMRFEEHIAEFLRSLESEDIRRYKNSMIEFKKAIDEANLEIQKAKEADRDYIRQFKKNNHL